MSDVRNPAQFEQRMYHATTEERWENIRSVGLNAPGAPREAREIHSFDDKQAASEYAANRFTAPDETPVVVSFPSSERTKSQGKRPSVGSVEREFYTTAGHIPPDQVRRESS